MSIEPACVVESAFEQSLSPQTLLDLVSIRWVPLDLTASTVWFKSIIKTDAVKIIPSAATARKDIFFIFVSKQIKVDLK